MRRICSLLFIIIILSTPLISQAAERAKKIIKKIEQEQNLPAIVSIIPAQAEPLEKVTITGWNFGENGAIYLGSNRIDAEISDKEIGFVIPEAIKPGIYVMYLKRDDSVMSKGYNFTVTPLKPVVLSLEPDKLSYCAEGRGREVILKGKNFSANSQLYFDSVIIASKVVSSSEISFLVPEVAGGLHQVLVKNGVDTSSAPLGLMIETKPEITSAKIGTEYVNYYEIVIDGKNFQNSSYILVDGVKIGGRNGADLESREKLIYKSCSKVVYQRHPYSPVNKEFQLQLMNQTGEGSQPITMNAP